VTDRQTDRHRKTDRPHYSVCRQTMTTTTATANNTTTTITCYGSSNVNCSTMCYVLRHIKPTVTKTTEVSTYREGINNVLPELTNVGGQCSSSACSTRQPRFTAKSPSTIIHMCSLVSHHMSSPKHSCKLELYTNQKSLTQGRT